MEFNAIFSQVALAACLRYLLAEGTAEGEALAKTRAFVEMEVQLKRKWKVVAPQISESQPLEVKREKSSVLPSDKLISGVEGERASENLQEEILEPPMESTTQPSQNKRK